MTATFWTGSSLSFTNGSKTVTVNTGPSLDSVKANSSLTAGNYNEPVEVKSVSGNTITLYNNWPGSTGTTSATIKPSAAAAASAGIAAQQLITEIQSLVGSASATATANSFVKRDSNGRMKAASPSANDDVVTKGYLGSASTKDVGTDLGNVMEVGAFGLSANIPAADEDGGLNQFLPTGFYDSSSSSDSGVPSNSSGSRSSTIAQQTVSTDASGTQIHMDCPANELGSLWFRNYRSSQFYDWKEVYHSGNTNFNEFGGVSPDDRVAMGVAISSTAARFYLPLNSKSSPSSISVVGTFSVIRDGLQTIATGVTPTLNAISSNKFAVVDFTGLTGLTAGQPVQLSTNTSSSKIAVNF